MGIKQSRMTYGGKVDKDIIGKIKRRHLMVPPL
jgi:hypothetical protein